MPAPIWPLVDRILDGGLRAFLLTERTAGKSYEDITRTLLLEHGVIVSSSMVRKWAVEQGVEAERIATVDVAS